MPCSQLGIVLNCQVFSGNIVGQHRRFPTVYLLEYYSIHIMLIHKEEKLHYVDLIRDLLCIA